MIRCNQCWRFHPEAAFVGARGNIVTWCSECRSRRKDGVYVRAKPRLGLRSNGHTRVTWTACSKNRKLGGIPASISSAETCPPSCGFFGRGCYAEFGLLRHHWARVPDLGLTWPEFLDQVRALPEGTLWRHNMAGDLAGIGDAIDIHRLTQLAWASHGRRGFTFTHKAPLTTAERVAFHYARDVGFTINLSADSLREADRLARLNVAPVCVVLPSNAPDRGTRTPSGRKVVVCPNETVGITCADCQLCAVPTRKSIVGFRAHGQMKKTVSELVQLRRKESAA